MTDECVRLDPSAVADGRPFTNPRHAEDDLGSLRTMLEGLRWVLSRGVPAAPRPLTRIAPEGSGRQHRAVLAHDALLHGGEELALVGFFAMRRTDRDCSPLMTMDEELILEFPRHPGILSYSSLELADGNWGNLILLHPPEARDTWREGERHAYAAGELAPRYYTTVRLHNGWLPGGLWSRRDPVLVRTKYYDFQGPEPWRAERELPAPP